MAENSRETEFHMALPKLDLNVTNRCNFRCVHCAFDSGQKAMAELSLGKIKRILQDTKQLGGERIDITGGEPLVREDAEEILKIAKALGFKVELVTNGSLLTRQRLQRFRSLGLDSIAISLDGSDYQTYSRIRMVSRTTYHHVVKAIGWAVELGLRTKVNTVVFNSNMEDIPSITKWCIKRGIYEHGLYYFTPVGRGSLAKALVVEPRKWLKFYRRNLRGFGSRIKLSVEFPLLEKGVHARGKGCILKEDPYHLQILPDGNVYPCAILASYGRPIGNLSKEQIKKVWKDRRRWETYCRDIHTQVFKKYKGYCVDFLGFGLERSRRKYHFICPLRKFIAGESA
jgi:MoaA/NifB/PqqE/SkfB family radical SAM enzyme